jgi:hypothetical protein
MIDTTIDPILLATVRGDLRELRDRAARVPILKARSVELAREVGKMEEWLSTLAHEREEADTRERQEIASAAREILFASRGIFGRISSRLKGAFSPPSDKALTAEALKAGATVLVDRKRDLATADAALADAEVAREWIAAATLLRDASNALEGAARLVGEAKEAAGRIHDAAGVPLPTLTLSPHLVDSLTHLHLSLAWSEWRNVGVAQRSRAIFAALAAQE